MSSQIDPLRPVDGSDGPLGIAAGNLARRVARRTREHPEDERERQRRHHDPTPEELWLPGPAADEEPGAGTYDDHGRLIGEHDDEDPPGDVPHIDVRA